MKVVTCVDEIDASMQVVVNQLLGANQTETHCYEHSCIKNTLAKHVGLNSWCTCGMGMCAHYQVIKLSCCFAAG